MPNLTLANSIQSWMMSAESNCKDEKKFKDGATLLLQCNRNKYMFNFLCRSWKTPLSKKTLIKELTKHLNIILSGLTMQKIESAKPIIEDIAKRNEELAANKAAGVEVIPPDQKHYKGKREDHEQLPDVIKACYVECLNLIRKMRAIHEKLKLMVDAKPCDRAELTMLMTDLDTQYHDNWERYDHYVIGQEVKEKNDNTAEIVDINVEQQKKTGEPEESIAAIISTCKSYISRYTGRLIEYKDDPLKLVQYTELRLTIQERYTKAVFYGAVFSEKTVEKLKKGGIEI